MNSPTGKISNLLELFQANCFPCIIEDYAEDLGVSADSIRRLAPGWVPVVNFKKGPNFQGWLAWPERDARGTCTGLSLRNQKGNKTSYPGSKHGLIYEVNPDHEHGEKGYSAGSHNWVRTTDAGLLCPVCGKPDGCLLSRESAHDPKAVICIRKQSGARLRFGFLHILKAEGQLSGRAALPDNGGPVIVVEGASDTCAAMDLGFNAVGRPSNLAGLDELADLIRGRDVIIVGENDKKENGDDPGKEGMIAAFQTAKRACKNVTMVMPPEHVKDLRSWKVKYGVTRETFLEYVTEFGQHKLDDSLIVDDRPTTIARAFLDSECRLAGRYILRQWEDSWYTYKNGKYVWLSDAAMIQPLYKWGYKKMVQSETPQGATKLNHLAMTTHTVNNLRQAIMAEVLVPGSNVPCWVNGVTGPDVRGLIVFNNGILNVPAYVASPLQLESDYFSELTPDLFVISALSFPYARLSTCPVWLNFLNEIFADDADKILFLQEFMGLLLTGDTRLHIFGFFVGGSGYGKGTILRVIGEMLGDLCVSSNITALCENSVLKL